MNPPSFEPRATLPQRRRELLARSSRLRAALASECQETWALVSPPIDRAADLRARALRVWHGLRDLAVRRPWLLLAAPLAWRLLRRRSGQATPAPGVARAARLAVWAGRLSFALRTWQVVRPLVQAWLSSGRRGRSG